MPEIAIYQFEMVNNGILRILKTGDTVSTLTGLSQQPRGFAYRVEVADEIVYYCSATDGKIHRRNATLGTETILPWPVSSVRCSGYSLKYSPSRNSLIFPYTQNNLHGVAEYLL